MKTEDLLGKFTEKAIKYLESAEAFATREIPIYIEELLTYRFYHEVMDLIYFFPFSLVICYGFYLAYKFVKDENSFTRECGLLLSIVSVVCSVAWTVNFIDQSKDLVKLKTAPRVYLVDYLRGR